VEKIKAFMEEHVYPNEAVLEEWHSGPNKWQIHPLNDKLKEAAKRQGLWNLWLPAGGRGRVRAGGGGGSKMLTSIGLCVGG
jgi:acyl-CoA dehydrogenase